MSTIYRYPVQDLNQAKQKNQLAEQTTTQRQREGARWPRLPLTGRDKQIVLMVHDYRVVTAEVVETRFFPHKTD